MDTVKGKNGISKNSLLVLTERKTRIEIIVKLRVHTTAEVVKAMNKLERSWNDKFKNVFKSFTVDNSTEFSDSEGVRKISIARGQAK